MTLQDLLSSFQSIKADIASGQYLKAVEDTLNTAKGVVDLVKAFTGGGVQGAAPSDVAATCHALAECVNACHEKLVVNAPVNVGAIGDGHLLQMLIQLLQTLAPLIPVIFHQDAPAAT